LELIVAAAPHYAGFVCPDGSSTFSSHKVKAMPKRAGDPVYFECNNLDEKAADLL
jgi:hypothetical protein